MESQQHHQEEINNGGAKISPSSSSYLCRQSSTRWTPTTEQIKLLKELYYINGVRSPTADQIQSICARLRRYGKIEGKNVFYWFQNHKARERQKKRLTPNANPNLPPTNQYQNENTNNIIKNGSFQWKQDQDFSLHNKYPSFNNPGFCCSSSSVGVVPGGGQLVSNFGYGGMTLENTFRDCSITGGGGILNGGNVNHNSYCPVGNYNPYAPTTYCSNLLDKISLTDNEDHDYYEQDDNDDVAPEIETLPLFPMHDDDDNNNNHHNIINQGIYTIKPGSEAYYTGGYRCSNGNNGSTSLELSLNSYGYTQFL